LKPGGYIWVETPNTDSFGYERYREHWRGLEAPRHLVLFNTASLRWSFEQAGFAGIRVLPPGDVVEGVFTMSAAIRLGRIVEKDPRPLPQEVGRETLEAARQARSRQRHDFGKAEFVTMAAYRPEAERP
jgi:hypothetical protein